LFLDELDERPVSLMALSSLLTIVNSPVFFVSGEQPWPPSSISITTIHGLSTTGCSSWPCVRSRFLSLFFRSLPPARHDPLSPLRSPRSRTWGSLFDRLCLVPPCCKSPHLSFGTRFFLTRLMRDLFVSFLAQTRWAFPTEPEAAS